MDTACLNRSESSLELPALRFMAGEEPPDCSGHQPVSQCPFSHGDPLCFVVVNLRGGEADSSHFGFIVQRNLAFLLLRGPQSMGLSRIWDAGEICACSLLSSITRKIGFPSKESKGIP